LTSSAVKVGSGEAGDGGYGKGNHDMSWQSRALRYIDLVPELNYASRFYSRTLKQLRLYPATLDEQGKLKEIKSGIPVDLLNRIHDPGGRHAQILSNYGRLMFATGEGNLFGYDLGSDDETWLFVWNDELSVERDGQTIKKITWEPTVGDKHEYGPSSAVVYRFWTPHPRRTGEADSPMRSIVEGKVGEELISLTTAVLSTATTRATNGMLLIPAEISPPEPEVADDAVEEQGLVSDLGRHLEAQYELAGTPAAVAPWLLEAAYDYIDRIRWVQMHDPQNDYMETALRKEAVERIARGIDFPAEALTGLGGTNHWAALQILMDMWKSHGAPLAQQFCDDVTSSYYREALRVEGYDDWQNTVVAFDDAGVVQKPDRSDDADKAWDRGQISDEGYRSMKDIPPEFAPSEEEKDLWLAVKMRDPSLIHGNQVAEPPQPDAAEGPAPAGPEGDSGRKTRVTASTGRELAAIELALMRCRELAGIRIHQQGKKFPKNIALIANEPYGQVAATLGKGILKEMGFTNSLMLVLGGADNLRSLLQVKGHSQESADAIGEMVEMLAADTLCSCEFPEVPPHVLRYLEEKEAA
jgi:hypothetical protein